MAEHSAEVVVIGGGVNGTSTAFQLAKMGMTDVILVERRQLGAGATGKSGALVRMHYTNVPESMLAFESFKIGNLEVVTLGEPQLLDKPQK